MSTEVIVALIVLAVLIIGAVLLFRRRNSGTSYGGGVMMPPASMPSRRRDDGQDPARGGGQNTPASESTETPDFDSMSPLELMKWMESVANRKSPDPEPEDAPPPRPAPSAPPQGHGGNFPPQEQIDRNVTEILGNLDKKMEEREESGDLPVETTTSIDFSDVVAPPEPQPAPKPAKPASPPAPITSSPTAPAAPADPMGGLTDTDGYIDDLLLEAEEDEIELEEQKPVTTPATSTIDNSAAYFLATSPKSMPLDEWQPMYAYVFRQSVAAQVYMDAAKLLGKKQAEYSTMSQPAATTIREGAEITATPELEGFQFKPLRVTVGFYDAWERFNFELRAKSAPLNQFATGRIVFTVEGLIVGEVPLSIFVGETSAEWEFKENPTKMYQAIFCSYSHTDTKIIERLERAYKSLGMDYLRDITTLKSGTHWSDELLALIDRADVFQLFWSKTAAESQYVKQEWEYALKYEADRPNFIRPVWWQDPMPPVPKELGHIHFWHQPDLEDEE